MNHINVYSVLPLYLLGFFNNSLTDVSFIIKDENRNSEIKLIFL